MRLSQVDRPTEVSNLPESDILLGRNPRMNAPPPESREVEVSYYKALALATGGIPAVFWEFLPSNTPKLFPLWGFRLTLAGSLTYINRLVGLTGN